jgi:hypothetical protein
MTRSGNPRMRMRVMRVMRVRMGRGTRNRRKTRKKRRRSFWCRPLACVSGRPHHAVYARALCTRLDPREYRK